MSEFVDYYEILQVHRSADPDVVEAAYKKLIFKHHPDRGGDPDTAKRITGAYYVLKDQTRRREYDSAYTQWTTSPSSATRNAYLDIDEIPQSAIDYILAATFTEMAAATVRTAGRVAGAVAVTGAIAVAEAASAGVGAVLDARRQSQDLKYQKAYELSLAEASLAKRRAWDLEVARAASGWQPAPTQAARHVFREFVAAPFADGRLGPLSDDDLVWMAVRHSQTRVRRLAFQQLCDRHPESRRCLVAITSEFSDPLALADTPEAFEKNLGAEPLTAVTAAAYVTAEEYKGLCTRAKRARVARSAIMSIVVLSLVVSVVWTQTDILQQLL